MAISNRNAAAVPFEVKAGLLTMPSDGRAFPIDLNVPDTWYKKNESVATPQSVTATTGQTLTAANLLNRILARSGSAGSDFSDTTPSAAALVQAVMSPAVNRSFDLAIQNTTAHTMTILAGSGVTLVGSTFTLATNVVGNYLIVFTNVTSGSEAVSLYMLGSSAV
jgi:hypothetical protein